VFVEKRRVKWQRYENGGKVTYGKKVGNGKGKKNEHRRKKRGSSIKREVCFEAQKKKIFGKSVRRL